MRKTLFPPRSKFPSTVHFHIHRATVILTLLFLGSVAFNVYRETLFQKQSAQFQNELLDLATLSGTLQQEATRLQSEIDVLKNEDTRKTNTELKARIAEVEKTFGAVSKLLETISDARGQGIAVGQYEKDLAKAVSTLSRQEYELATKELAAVTQKLNDAIAKKQADVALAAQPAQDLPASGSYRRQSVTTTRGTFTVSLIAEQTSSVKMITDTENSDTCTKDCPAVPLATYVSRNGGFAGINGSYFCPPDYPTCADKVNSFNTLVFNARLKKYMNSDENVYSVNPMVVQNADRSMRFMGQASEWGRDTGIIGGISNYPMLVSGSTARVTETGGKGPRGFVGAKGGTIYIGIVHGADLADAAAVLATLGLENAMNLDGGGSSALYYNGKYVVGPGRNLPNALILAR